MALTSAHQGYEYQDILIAARLVDLILGSVVGFQVDKKLVQDTDDIFDDLTTVDWKGFRERTQIKYTARDDRALTLETFTQKRHSLRLDRIISTVLADRKGPGSQATHHSYRIVMRDVEPSGQLAVFLRPADPDPGPFLPAMNSVRFRFHADSLWSENPGHISKSAEEDNPFTFLKSGERPVNHADLNWVCEHLVVELCAPSASLDLTRPGTIEQLLLRRVRNEIGVGKYPNKNRTDTTVAASLVDSARAARLGTLTVSAPEVLRRAQLRIDLGAVERANPVDKALEVERPEIVTRLVEQTTEAADDGNVLLLVGPPGQGKSWTCQQLIEGLLQKEWIVAEHYCYLGDADQERIPRARAESVFGSLLQRIAEHTPELISSQRPRFTADEKALEEMVGKTLQMRPRQGVALVVDGIDHVTRVLAGGPAFDPSYLLAEALAGLYLPKGSTLIVLSQPGNHLAPLEATGAHKVNVPGLSDGELRSLATHLGVTDHTSGNSQLSSHPPLLEEGDVAEEFVAILLDRSGGNALYATYLCQEALRSITTRVDPVATVRGLPQFDGSLHSYYQHIQKSLGPQGDWVADVMALLDFPVSLSDLREIRPTMVHMVDEAVDVMRPVLTERVSQGGLRIYHESFARFLRLRYQDVAVAKTALFREITDWLKGKGMFKDLRAFRHLLSALAQSNRDQEVVDTVDRDFVVRSIAAGFPVSAIIENLGVAIRSAAATADWPAVVRYVEMIRAAVIYQEECSHSVWADFSDVIGALLGPDVLAERLLHNGRPIMDGRSGLEICATLDAMGAVVPWREYLLAFFKEADNDNTMYGEESDRQVSISCLRGRLRLLSLKRGTNSDNGGCSVLSSGTQDYDLKIYAPLNWGQLAESLNEGFLSPTGVVEAFHDTFGLSGVVELIGKAANPGSLCLALAQYIEKGAISGTEGEAIYWARKAVECSLPPGNAEILLRIGLNVDEVDSRPASEGRTRLLELTRKVQDPSVRWDTELLDEWLDACTVAARKDELGLTIVETQLKGPGWYTCWLRFVIALVTIDVTTGDGQAQATLGALRILTEVDDPSSGEPRASDLLPIHGLIDETIRRAFCLLDDHTWGTALEILFQAGDSSSTMVSGELNSPIPHHILIRLAIDTATPTRFHTAQRLVEEEIERSATDRDYYSDFSTNPLLAARLALKMNDSSRALSYWTEACKFLVAYGSHKDATVYELLNPLSELIALDNTWGRRAVAKMQAMCRRISRRTDGDGTRYVERDWWELLAEVDPCSLSKFVLPRLLGSCNDPNWLLHSVRADLWRKWHQQADPFVANALRLTIEEPLEESDIAALGPLADTCDGTGLDEPSRLLSALLARFDERSFDYSFSNGKELLERDCSLAKALNAIAKRARLPGIFPLPTTLVGSDNQSTTVNRNTEDQLSESVDKLATHGFPTGAAGISQAIHVWGKRKYGETYSDWSVERFANVLGYRIIELIEDGQEQAGETCLRLIADTWKLDDEAELLKTLAEGFERHGQEKLATVAYTLDWTRARGGGGWNVFGGETDFDSLQNASRLNPTIALTTVAGEVERFAALKGWIQGIAQALIYAFARGVFDNSESAAFDLWNEAFAVISDRVPRVSADDDPDDVYVAPENDIEGDLRVDIDSVLAAAAVAGLAHPGRELKRRSLLAIQFLMCCRPKVVAPALASALTSLSDPATLTWLLRVIELAGEKAAPIVEESQGAFSDLVGRPHLTVRAIARRLLVDSRVPMAPSTKPDLELLETSISDLHLPFVSTFSEETTGSFGDRVNLVAGIRLSRGEILLPGLREAVRNRVNASMEGEEQKQRLQAQRRSYADEIKKRWPDVFLVPNEAVEDAIQRVAAGARAARILNGEAVTDPIGLEEGLAEALLDDPEFPLLLEGTRYPRPEIPPPPGRDEPLWNAPHLRGIGGEKEGTCAESAGQRGGDLFRTVSVSGLDSVPHIVDGPYNGWRLVATIERREIPRPAFDDHEYDIAFRLRAIEKCSTDSRHNLTILPVAEGDVRVWQFPTGPYMASSASERCRPAIGIDSEVNAFSDGHLGLGVHTYLPTPTPWLYIALELTGNQYFLMNDDEGTALALITWRTEYETSDYYLAWPRLYGAGIVVRDDAFERLVHGAQGNLKFRDFLQGSSSLCN